MAEVIPSATTTSDRSRTGADRFLRQLLRVEGPAQKGAIFGARDAMSRSLLVSALRCVLTYLVIPLAGTTAGVLETFSAPVSIALCLFAGFMSVRSTRRFFLADHSKRFHYAAFAGAVLCFLAFAIVTDIASLVS